MIYTKFLNSTIPNLAAVLNQWNVPLEWNGGMEWWNEHFNHFLMDGGKGSSRGQYIRMTLDSIMLIMQYLGYYGQ